MHRVSQGCCQMIGTTLLALLSALGIVFLLLCGVGALLLPSNGNGEILLFTGCAADCRMVQLQVFLWRCGICRLPLTVVDIGLPPQLSQTVEHCLRVCSDARFVTLQQWKEWKKTELDLDVSGT